MAKRVFLYLAKYIGLFALSRKVTRNYLRIVCYHGISAEDEHLFRPVLFMSCDSFQRRMEFLPRIGFTPISLEDGLRRWQTGRLSSYDVVITIDDGWQGTYSCMGPALERLGFPATLYVSSYYLDKPYQVFNVALAYVLWKASQNGINLSPILSLIGEPADLAERRGIDEIEEALLAYGESLDSAQQRQRFLEEVIKAAGLDPEKITMKRKLAYMSKEETRSLVLQGVDIQLHTHRHFFPSTSVENARREIEDNRSALADVTESVKEHFCYPSGQYTDKQLHWMQELGLSSATTTEPGINPPGRSIFELRRILDSQEREEIELEAELSGFAQLVRNARRFLSERLGGRALP